jgi:predicted acylesterase/phospholipase RssA
MCLYNWSIAHCSNTFDDVLEQFFGPNNLAPKSFFGHLRGYLQTWITDGQYNTTDVEAYLKSIFGASRRLQDPETSSYSGAKVAVTATNISNASMFLFSNYNTIEKKNCGMNATQP